MTRTIGRRSAAKGVEAASIALVIMSALALAGCGTATRDGVRSVNTNSTRCSGSRDGRDGCAGSIIRDENDRSRGKLREAVSAYAAEAVSGDPNIAYSFVAPACVNSAAGQVLFNQLMTRTSKKFSGIARFQIQRYSAPNGTATVSYSVEGADFSAREQAWRYLGGSWLLFPC